MANVKGSMRKIKKQKKPLKAIVTKKPNKKEYLLTLDIKISKAIRDYLSREKEEKVSFSQLVDYLLKNFYNQFKEQIENPKKEGGKT